MAPSRKRQASAYSRAGFGLAVIFGLCAAAGWMYSRQSVFRLSRITVESTDAALRVDIRNRLLSHLGSGLFALSLPDLEQEILEVSSVSGATIYRRWPAEIVIRPKLKQAVAMTFVGKELWTLDENGEKIEVLRKPAGLILARRMPADSSVRREVFAWLASPIPAENGGIEVSQFDEMEWITDRGLVLRSLEPELEVELGFGAYAAAWSRLARAHRILTERGVKAAHLDASYPHRVVVGGVNNLRIFQNGLDLKRLGRRAGGESPEAR